MLLLSCLLQTIGMEKYKDDLVSAWEASKEQSKVSFPPFMLSPPWLITCSLPSDPLFRPSKNVKTKPSRPTGCPMQNSLPLKRNSLQRVWQGTRDPISSRSRSRTAARKKLECFVSYLYRACSDISTKIEDLLVKTR